MKEFIQKFGAFCIFFLLIGSVVIFCLFAFANSYLSHNRLAALKTKHEILEQTISPRLILIGGSNLPYGINSALVQDSSRRNVVNMGLQGSLGLRFMLEEVVDEIKEGDIVVVVPEYQHFFNLNSNGESTLYRALVQYPEGIRHLNTTQKVRFFYYLPNVLQGVLEDIKFEAILGVTGKAGYHDLQNGFGDYEGHRTKKNKYTFPKTTASIPGQDFQEESIKLLRAFGRRIAEKNAHMYIALPATATSYASIFPKQALISRLKEFQVLGDTLTFTYSDSCFYDTPHHLGFQHKTENSLRLWAELKVKLDQQNGQTSGL